VLILGAGVSQSYGLPNWNDLVLTLLLDESSRAFDQFWPHYRVPLGSWLAETFGLSPAAMARLARAYARRNNLTDHQFQVYVRDELYRFQQQPKEPTTLSGLVDLLMRSTQDQNGWHIPLVATFNFDDLLERKLGAAGVCFAPVYRDTRRTEDKLAILHVHGYLPSEDPIPEAELILTEDEYHRLSFAAFHWSQIELVHLLRNYTALFVGLSMSDPNLRRLLDASHAPNSGTNHFVIRKEYSLTPEERVRAHEAIVNKARIQAVKLGVEGVETTAYALDHALENMLRQAREYETELLHDMGVETIWFQDFDKVAAFLSVIADQGNEGFVSPNPAT
jgi:SIR2-like domain